MTTADTDPFWVKNRAEFLAKLSSHADPGACGTCRSRAEAGEPVEHEECQQRATLLQAPDHPYYEILAGFPLEENEKLPARFHIPVFDDCGVPNSWLCAVCQEEGQVVGWPCATATKYGTQVFSDQHKAETAHQKQAARIAALEDEVARLRDQQSKDDDEFAQAIAERDEARRQLEAAGGTEWGIRFADGGHVQPVPSPDAARWDAADYTDQGRKAVVVSRTAVYGQWTEAKS